MNTLNTTRLTGLASGMDTDSIIKNMMQIEQLKVNRELRSRTLMTWRQDQLKDVSSDISEFKNSFLSVVGSKSMVKSGTYIKFDVKTDYKGGAVSVAANSNNTSKSVVVNEVMALAAEASAKSATDPATNRGSVLNTALPEGSNITTKLGDLDFENALEFDENGNISFEINGKAFTFNRNDSLQKMLSDVSGDKDAGVVLNYSRLSNTFTLQTKETGADKELSFRNLNGGNMFGVDGALQIDTTDDDGNSVFKGQNAKVRINDVVVEKSSNNFTVDGLSFTLNRVTGADEEDIRFDITQNFDDAVNSIKEFVDGYNTLIKKLEGMLNDRKTNKEKGYTPLTDEEKATMTEKQIEDWEKIAKKGLFTNDSDLRNLLSDLRNAMYETVEGLGMSASAVGIKTGNYFSGKRGEIELDETALRAALEKDSTKVMQVFMNVSNSADPKTKRAESGFMFKIQNAFDSYTSTIKDDRLTAIDKDISKIDDKISRLQTQMARKEEKLYMQFAAMEKAMAELQNQTNSLVSMLGQGK